MTWQQPFSACEYDSLTKSDDGGQADEPEIFKLPDDCLHEIVKRCDLESLVNLFQVCKRFNKLFMKQTGGLSDVHFRRFQTLQIKACGSNMGTHDTIAMVRKYMRRVGPFVQRLSIRCDELHQEFLHRYLAIINAHLNEKLYELKLINVDVDMHMQFLQPILRRIKVLITDNVVPDFHTDLENYCPNLTSLEIKRLGNPATRSDGIFESHFRDLDHINAVLFSKIPTLQHLSIGFHMSFRNFLVFSQTNSHLKTLKFVCHDDRMLRLLYLFGGLEQLEIEGVKSLLLTNFRQLHDLNCLALQFESSFYDEIIRTFPETDELRELKLKTIGATANQEALVNLIDRLPQLENLHLYGVLINATIVIDIIRTAGKLKTFHFSEFGGNFEHSLVQHVANIYESEHRQGPLKLFITSDMENKDKKTLINGADQRFVKLYFVD